MDQGYEADLRGGDHIRTWAKHANVNNLDGNELEILNPRETSDFHVKVLWMVEYVAPVLVADATPFQVPRVSLLADELPAFGASGKGLCAAFD